MADQGLRPTTHTARGVALNAYFRPAPKSKPQYMFDGPYRTQDRLFRFPPGSRPVRATRKPPAKSVPLPDIIAQFGDIAPSMIEHPEAELIVKDVSPPRVVTERELEPFPECMFLTEGIWDTCAMWEFGYNVMGIQAAAQSHIHPDFLTAMTAFDPAAIFLLMDNDDAGRRGRLQLFSQLPKGKSFNVEYPATVHDFCELEIAAVAVLKSRVYEALENAVDQLLTKAQEQKTRAAPSTTLTFPRLELELVDGDIIKDLKMHFLWPRRIPKGQLSILCGVWDVGKGVMLANIVAAFTTGKKWLDATNENPPGLVLYMAAEDSLKMTVVPRLKAAGTDMHKVKFLTQTIEHISEKRQNKRMLDLSKDLAAITDTCRALPIQLIVVDPISSYLGRDINHNNVSHVKSVLDPLQAFAEDTGVSILTTGHFNKNESQSVVMRLAGSYADVGVETKKANKQTQQDINNLKS